MSGQPPYEPVAEEPIDTSALPLSQELIMEVLGARYRLGEHMWPFPNRAKRALDALASLGLLNHKSGIVERTRNAWLTDLGRASVLSADYVPAVRRRVAPHAAMELAGQAARAPIPALPRRAPVRVDTS